MITGINFKFGIVSEAKPGFAKVFFEADNIVTDFWPIIMATTLKDKPSFPLNAKEHVACLCDARCEEGVILGSIYSNVDTPENGAGAGKFRMRFEDGTFIEYDKTAHKLTASVQGMADITAINDITATSQTNIKAKATVQATIEAPLITLKGNVSIAGTLSAGSLSLAPVPGATGADGKVHGDINLTGDVKADGDVKAGAISLAGHTHGGVQTGSGVTGPAQ